MSDVEPVRGIVVAHGAMAEGLVDAVRHIAGDAADGLVALSNAGMSPERLAAELEELAGSRPVVVFADLQTGSCGMAAARSCRGADGRVVVCGVNLPMLLDFVFAREVPMEEMAARLVSSGREAIRPAPSRG